MIRLQRLMSVSRSLFHFCKVVKQDRNILKLSRIFNSGWLTAGCCFSRQSDEEKLVSSVKSNHENFVKIQEREHFHSNSGQHALNSRNMKRSFECINDATSLDADTTKNAVQQESVIHNKKKKSNDSEIILNEGIQQELPGFKNNYSADFTSEPPNTENKEVQIEKQSKEKGQRIRPNYFVAIQITDGEIHEKLQCLQNDILEKESNLKNIMINLQTLHITLMVMNIGDTETHNRALKALESLYHQVDEDLSRNPLQLEFQGLGHFQNRVLYAKLKNNEGYQRLCTLAENVKKQFETVSIFATDSKEDFAPHLTIAKINFKKKQNKRIKKIEPALYEEFRNEYFGSQEVKSIQLLKMMGPKNEVGYYSGNEIYFSAFDQSARRKSLNEMLATEEKKKNIKETISGLTKEKLKL